MHVLEALEHLIDNVLLVNVFKDISADDCMEVSVHKIEDKVDIAVVFCADNVLKADDILVAVQFLKEDDLAERPLSISSVLERIEVLLKSHDLLCLLVDCLPNDTVSTLS